MGGNDTALEGGNLPARAIHHGRIATSARQKGMQMAAETIAHVLGSASQLI